MEIAVISILILLNGFFALSEIALVSSKKARLEQLKADGIKGAGIALKLLSNSENFLSAVQVGITLIGIITGVYGGLNIAEDLAPVFAKITFLETAADEIAILITVVTITYFSIVIGELVPKTIAINNPEKVAVRIAPVIFYFSKLFYPFVWLLSVSTNLFNRLLGIRKAETTLTEMELRHILKTASSEGVIEQEQNIIHEKLFYFADKRAKHLMTHRMDIDWLDLNDPPEKIKETILSSRHSKLICSRDELDNFTGILHIKDYLLALNKRLEFSVSDLLETPLIVPENMDAVKLWKLFKSRKKYTSIIVNEYGGIEGLITLHDIVENIIGDIPEEGEEAEPDIFIRDDKTYLVSGDAPVEVLDGIVEGFTIDFEEVDYSTVAGFVLSYINKIPQIGDKFMFKNYVIEVVDIDGNRIDKILISPPQKK